MICIVDTGGANIASVGNALERLGKTYQLSDDPDNIRKSSHVILPGVGAAAPSMNRLKEKALSQCLCNLKQPVLGICLGMQLFFEGSEEGSTDCLGIFPGRVTQMRLVKSLPIPHMGWNTVRIIKTHPLLEGITDGSYFYFVHSYTVPSGSWNCAVTDYGFEFPAVVGHENFMGVQFHPERSSILGEQLIRNFLKL